MVTRTIKMVGYVLLFAGAIVLVCGFAYLYWQAVFAFWGIDVKPMF